MADAVKRAYRSELRAAQAGETRNAVVTGATELFCARGYGATTVDDVAKSAGVSRKTVFTAVGGTLELLKTAIDVAVAGDDAPVALADRLVVRDLLDNDDPRALLAGWVHMLVDIDTRVGALMRALEVAADADPEAYVLIEQSQRERLSGARAVVRRLVSLDALNPALTRSEATDIAWLASDPVLYDRMVRTRKWSTARFEKWLADSLCRQLLKR